MLSDFNVGQILAASNLVQILALLVVLVLAYVIARYSDRKISDHFFLAITLASALWITTNLFTNFATAGNQGSLLFWARITLLGPAFVPMLIILFADSFPENKIRLSRLAVGILLALTATILISIPTSLNVRSVTVIDPNRLISDFEPGPIYVLFSAFLIFSILFAVRRLLGKYHALTLAQKAQIRTVLIGFVLSVVFGLMISAILPLVGVATLANLGPVSVLFFVAASAYAIIKHRLLNIRLIVTEIVVYIALIILAAEIFISRTMMEAVFRAFFLLVAIYGGRLLIKTTQAEIDRRQEVEKLAKERQAAVVALEQQNKNLATLQKIAEVVLNESDMKIMTQKILDELPKQLESCAGGFLAIVRESNLVAYAFSSHAVSDKIMSLIGGSLDKYSYPIDKDFNLLHRTLVERKPLDSDNLTDFTSPPLPKSVAMTIQKLVGIRHVEAFPLYAGGEPFGVMLFLFTKPKEAIHDRNYAVARAIADDMSLAIQRAKAFQDLREANAYLADLDKLKDEFISIASHELNTPLAAVEGYLSMILEEGMGKVDPKAKEYLRRAYDSSKRLAELIMDLLNVSRIEQGRLKMKFVKSNLYDLAESVVHELQIKADAKKLSLKLEADRAKVPETWCDADRIREVFVNLVGNSIKYTQKGGITIRIHGDDHKVTAEVSDTGRGIAKVDQKKLFQKFSQVKREQDQQHGTGLGLYISKNFIELHKGRIWVESEEGKGSTFAFEIPVLKAAPKEVEGAVLENNQIPIRQLADQIPNKSQSQNSKVPTGQDVPVEVKG